MAQRLFLILFFLCLALRAEGLMVRVVEIVDGRTIVINRHGTRETIRLAGIEITNEVHARALLRWTLGTSWVMVEPRGDGHFVYRSPDALFINRELVARGFARATRTDIDPQPPAMVTYLGTVQPMDPLPRDTTSRRSSSRRGTASAPNGRGRTNSGTRRRSPARSSRSSPEASSGAARPEDGRPPSE